MFKYLLEDLKLSGPVLLDEPLVVDDVTEEKEDDESEEKDEEESEEVDEEDKEDDEKEESSLSRFTLDDLKTAFKDKPDLLKEAKHAFFREQQFTELFPTVEDAKRAAEIQVAYEEITAAVIEGNVDKFISELKSENPDGVKRFASNFLPSIFELDKDLYLDIAEPVVKQFLKRAYDHGRGLDNEQDRKNITNAAKIIRKLLFGGGYEDIDQETGLVKKDKKEKTEVDKDKEAYFARKYSELHGEIAQLTNSKLEEEINKGLDDLTKTKPGLKKMIAKDIKSRVLEAMQADSAYIGRMNTLWKREERTGFGGSLKASFLATYMAKAKTLIPKLRIEARKEALGKEDTQNDKDSRTRLTGGKEKRGSGDKMTIERVKKEGLTTRQIFD